MNKDRAARRARNRRSQAVKAYFARARFPRWTLWFALPVVVAMAWRGDAVSYLLGAALLVMPGWTWRRWMADRDHSRFDAWRQEACRKVELRALVKLGIDRSEVLNEEPVRFESPETGDAVGAFRGLLIDPEGVSRYTPIHFTVFNFTAHKMAVYQCDFDLTTGTELDERLDECFYKHIVSHTVDSHVVCLHRKEIRCKLRGRRRRRILKDLRPRLVDGRVQIKTGETLILATAGGDRMRIALMDPQFADRPEGFSLPNGYAEKSVALVRRMLNERHTA